MDLKTKITKMHYDKNAKGLGFSALKTFSVFYYLISEIRNFLYNKNILKSKKVDAYVISVGNLTTGGVGKTPIVAEIAKYLNEKGEKVAIISRGYGGTLSNKNVNVISDGNKTFYNSTEAGDEPFWFTQNVKGVCVLTSKNRVNACNYAIKNFGITKVILDDGFQHRKLHRDLDIVLIDSEKQLGNEQLLPAGPLREPKTQINRANKIIIVDKSLDLLNAKKVANTFAQKKPSFICTIKPDCTYNIKTQKPLSKDTPCVAMCAIGQPQQFYNFLSDYNVIYKKTFDDHHKYTLNDIENIEENIITTEKDAVKLLKFNKNNIFALKLKSELDIEALLE